MRLQSTIKLAVSVGVLAMAGVSFGQSFTLLPNGTDVMDMTDDGSILVGNNNSAGEAYYWTKSDGRMFLIGGMGSPAISNDGSSIVGRAAGPDGKEEAAIWLGDKNWETLGNVPGGESCDNFRSSLWGTNGDGSFSVGLAWIPGCGAHACTYDDVNGMVDLGSTVDGRSSRANDVSADGNVVIGWQDATDGFRQGASWNDGVQTLYTYPFDGVEYPVGEAQAINANGSVIVGGSTVLGEGWLWTEANGVEATGVLPGFNYRGINFCTNADGTVVGGMSGFGFDRRGHIWTPDTGIQSANDFLTAAGVELPDGFGVALVSCISLDGQLIAGFGYDANFNLNGFIADLSASSALELTVDPLIAGQKALIQVDGAEPGTKVFLAYSLEGTGETAVPQLNVTLDIAAARRLNAGRANDDGHLQYMAPVPAGMAGREVWLQAAATDMTSNVHSTVIDN